MLPVPVVEQIGLPHEAFRTWAKYPIHGRILVLMDRYLNAEEVEHGTVEFISDEFGTNHPLESLCTAIDHDSYGIVDLGSGCTVEQLNGLLKTQNLYPAMQQKRPELKLPSEILNITRSVRVQALRFLDLPDEWKGKVIEFNRKLLEFAYPGIAPRKSTWSFVGTDNYVYMAVREGYFRKIYHVIPESAWPEVERTLSAYRGVEASKGGFTIVIENITPVHILRLRDLPAMSEKTVLNISGSCWSTEELMLLANMIKNGRIINDLTTVSGKVPAESLGIPYER